MKTRKIEINKDILGRGKEVAFEVYTRKLDYV
jgi:hypothetical protein